MNNHFHLIWQMTGDHKRENVQRDFLKFTGQHIIYGLKDNSEMLTKLTVNAKDRKGREFFDTLCRVSWVMYGGFRVGENTNTGRGSV